MSLLPAAFVRTITEVHGAAGEAWLHRLPPLLTDCAARWSLTLDAPFPALSYNYAAPGHRTDGTPVVLKAGVPHRELRTEIEALRLFNGRGSVRLLAADAEAGVLLLERIQPGTSLRSLSGESEDTRATALAADVLARLARPVVPADSPFPTTADWAQGLTRLRTRFGGGTGSLPGRLVQEAEAHFAVLHATQTETVVLHGDLHHGNILRRGKTDWVAIDPKGVVGEPAYEAGAWLRNPLPELLQWSNPPQVLARRLAQFAERFGWERERLRMWGMAQAVLSAAWSVEDHGAGGTAAITCAAILASLGR